MITQSSHIRWPGTAAVATAITALAIGCSGPANVGTVTGVVTLDGQPLPEASVTFQPQHGSPSAGTTDSSGRYELRYTRSMKGAVVGEHAVAISTYKSGAPDADPPIERRPEQVPPKYNRSTELTATVGPRANQIDFSLEASGKVPQPKPGEY